MPVIPASLVAAVPRTWATPLLIAAGALAAFGTGLVLLATVFGTWTPALAGGGCFTAAGFAWHLADGGSH